MPLTLTLTAGVLPTGVEKQAIAQLTSAMLEWHKLSGNKVMEPNITAAVHILPVGSTFCGGEECAGAWVEWKTPSFAFNTVEIQQGFFAQATQIIHELSGGHQPKENIYINVVHAVDGAWNLNGRAMSNKELSAAIAKG